MSGNICVYRRALQSVVSGGPAALSQLLLTDRQLLAWGQSRTGTEDCCSSGLGDCCGTETDYRCSSGGTGVSGATDWEPESSGWKLAGLPTEKQARLVAALWCWDAEHPRSRAAESLGLWVLQSLEHWGTDDVGSPDEHISLWSSGDIESGQGASRLAGSGREGCRLTTPRLTNCIPG